MEKTKFTDETTPLQKLDSFKQALKSTFAEPPEVQRRRLASEFSTMKQRVTESIDRFAFRFKNNLHRLAKLGEPVDRNSPQFIMSQFISKTKPGKTTMLRTPKEVTKFAVYGTNINDLPAFYQTNHVDMAVFTTVTLVPSQVARILIMQTLVHLLQTPAKFNHHRQP
ncbi:unnamed protein product, partial [Porites evermanni]